MQSGYLTMQTKRARDFMSIHYAAIDPQQSIAAAAKTLLEYHQSALPVVDEHKKLIGLISEADCMRSALVDGYFNEGVSLVKEHMTTEPEYISPELELSAVSEAFLGNHRRMMPVVEAGVLVGIVLRQDILKALLDNLSQSS